MAKDDLKDVSDLIYIKGKVDRIEVHHNLFKQDVSDIKTTLSKIESTLIGSTFNGNKGIITLIEQMDERIYELEKKTILLEDSMFNTKWSNRVLIASLLGFVFWYIKTK